MKPHPLSVILVSMAVMLTQIGANAAPEPLAPTREFSGYALISAAQAGARIGVQIISATDPRDMEKSAIVLRAVDPSKAGDNHRSLGELRIPGVYRSHAADSNGNLMIAVANHRRIRGAADPVSYTTLYAVHRVRADAKTLSGLSLRDTAVLKGSEKVMRFDLLQMEGAVYASTELGLHRYRSAMLEPVNLVGCAETQGRVNVLGDRMFRLSADQDYVTPIHADQDKLVCGEAIHVSGEAVAIVGNQVITHDGFVSKLGGGIATLTGEPAIGGTGSEMVLAHVIHTGKTGYLGLLTHGAELQVIAWSDGFAFEPKIVRVSLADSQFNRAEPAESVTLPRPYGFHPHVKPSYDPAFGSIQLPLGDYGIVQLYLEDTPRRQF